MRHLLYTMIIFSMTSPALAKRSTASKPQILRMFCEEVGPKYPMLIVLEQQQVGNLVINKKTKVGEVSLDDFLNSNSKLFTTKEPLGVLVEMPVRVRAFKRLRSSQRNITDRKALADNLLSDTTKSPQYTYVREKDGKSVNGDDGVLKVDNNKVFVHWGHYENSRGNKSITSEIVFNPNNTSIQKYHNFDNFDDARLDCEIYTVDAPPVKTIDDEFETAEYEDSEADM